MTSWHLLPVNFVNICSVTNTRILFTTHRLESRNGVAVAVRNRTFKEVFFFCGPFCGGGGLGRYVQNHVFVCAGLRALLRLSNSEWSSPEDVLGVDGTQVADGGVWSLTALVPFRS